MSEGADMKKRRFLTATTSVIGAVGVVGVAVPFIASWQPSTRAKAAGAPVEADISKLGAGELLRVKWRGKPVWIMRRTEKNLEDLKTLDRKLADPASDIPQQPDYAKNPHRSRKPEIWVAVGICTHLGCSPTYRPDVAPDDLGPDWVGGFYCACHGSRFDMAGRVFQGVPAPTNLEVPAYHYESETRIVIGVDPASAQA